MGAAAPDVLGIKPLVEADRGVDRLHDRVRAGGETSAPHDWDGADEQALLKALMAGT
jgi:hypothetical protein